VRRSSVSFSAADRKAAIAALRRASEARMNSRRVSVTSSVTRVVRDRGPPLPVRALLLLLLLLLARPTGSAAGWAVLAHRVGVAVAAGVGAHLDGVHAPAESGW
jgi:hypothetical protein